jgi:IclR family transcriptional regulator, KDG regulon repressor
LKNEKGFHFMQNVSGTVSKAIDVLDFFLKGKSEIGLGEIAESTGYNTATVYRLLATLVKRGLVSQEKKKGKYSLGAKTVAYGFMVRTNLNYLDTLYFHLSKLCREQSVVVNATMLNENRALVIDEIGIANDFRITALVGKRMPLHATAAGKIHLAFMSPGEQQTFFNSGPLEGLTPRTVTDVEHLKKELEAVRREGVAFDLEEHIQGTWAVAAPIFTAKEVVPAAASVVSPISRVDAYRSQQLVAALKSCAAEISLVLGRSNRS